MKVIESIAESRDHLDAARARGQRIGLVPTMGYLHDGHLSLVDASRQANDLTVVSIFVNPLQFSADEDLEAYPRDFDRDAALCAERGVDLVFAPTAEEMYPLPPLTTVNLSGITARLEGAARPTHFAGVATVVAKLFNVAGRGHAYFGEKDWQQLIVVRRMAADLSFPVEVVGCPIVREPDGLAMSSRNVYLEPDQRRAATVLSRALRRGIDLVEAGERRPAVVEAAIRDEISSEEAVSEPDYVAVVDAETLQEQDRLAGHVRLLVAARVGRPRLLDNMGVWA